MADFTSKKFIDLAGLKAFYDKHQEQINNQINTVSSDLSDLEGATGTAFNAINNSLDTKADKSELISLSTVEEVQAIIDEATATYSETLLNIQIDGINGEVV